MHYSLPVTTTCAMCCFTLQATSISVLAWLNDEEYMGNVRKAMEWIVAQCQNGRFGSTQATVLALKAIIAYDIKSARPKCSGKVHLSVDGEVVDSLSFAPESEGAIAFDTSKV